MKPQIRATICLFLLLIILIGCKSRTKSIPSVSLTEVPQENATVEGETTDDGTATIVDSFMKAYAAQDWNTAYSSYVGFDNPRCQGSFYKEIVYYGYDDYVSKQTTLFSQRGDVSSWDISNIRYNYQEAQGGGYKIYIFDVNINWSSGYKELRNFSLWPDLSGKYWICQAYEKSY